MYLGRGWQTEPLADVDGEQGRFLRETASEIYFPLHCDPATINKMIPRCGASEVQFRAYSEKGGVVLQLDLNGRRLDPIELKEGWADYRAALPAGTLPDEMNLLQFLHPEQAGKIALASIEFH